jgi:hypothetical protein
MGALQVAEKVDVLKGHDFSRAAKGFVISAALAAEGCFLAPVATFSAASLAPADFWF